MDSNLNVQVSDELVSHRAKVKVVQIAQDMITGRMGILLGARLLTGLRFQVTDDPFDPDFNIFVGIDAETDDMPLGEEERKYWAPAALAEKDKEINAKEEFFRDQALTGCCSLIARFGQEAGLQLNHPVRTYNILQTILSCPQCEHLVDVEIEMLFGDVHTGESYSLGEEYKWLPDTPVEAGGRPEDGNLDGEGFTECPHCLKDFYVDVYVRNDIISDVKPNLAKNPVSASPSADLVQPATADTQAVPRQEKSNKDVKIRPGQITYNPQWELTPRRKTALLRLAELGVDVYSSAESENFRLLVPFNLHPDVYVEIGYLIAQLGDEDFPNGFHHPIAGSSVKSALFDSKPGIPSPVCACDSLPQGLRYVVTPGKEL